MTDTMESAINRPTYSRSANNSAHDVAEKVLDTPDPPQRAMWHPKVLRLPMTLFLLLLLLVLIAVLEVFIRSSRQHNGYSVPSSLVQGLFTYLPVVIFIFVDFYWKSLELKVKLIAPWAHLRRKFSRAEDTVLLDYLNANYIVVIFGALKRRHWNVLLATLGSSFVAVLVVVSTSFWEIELYSMPTRNISLQRTSSLEGGSFHGDPNNTYIDRHFANILYDLSLPNWMQGPYAFNSFQIAKSEGGLNSGNLTAQTTAYSGDLLCEDIVVSPLRTVEISTNHTGPDLGKLVWQIEASWKGCKSTLNLTHPAILSCEYVDPNRTVSTHLGGPDRGYAGNNFEIECAGSRTNAVVIALFNETKVEQVVGMACSPSYSRYDAAVTVNSSSYALVGEPYISNGSQVDLPSGDKVLDWITSNLKFSYTCGTQFGESFGTWGWSSDLMAEDFYSHSSQMSAWLNIVIRTQQLTASNIMNLDILKKASQTAFRNLFPYLAQQTFANPAQDAFQGAYTVQELRLESKDTSVRIAQAALICLLLILVALYVLRPRTNLPIDPSSLASSTIILASSPDAAVCFSGTSLQSEQELRSHLKNSEFHTVLDAHGSLIISAKSPPTGSPSLSPGRIVDSGSKQFWNPPMLHAFAKVLLPLVIIAIIATLEVLLRMSEKNHGIGDAVDPANASAKYYAWEYAPPVVLFVVGLAIQSFHFAVCTITPYAKLAKKHQRAALLTLNPVAQGLYTLIPRSLRRGMKTVAFSAFTALLVPVAKTAIAGVFTSQFVDMPSSITSLPTLSAFNQTWNRSDMKSLYGSISSLHLLGLTTIQNYSLPLPAWTTDTLALGPVQLPTTENSVVVADLPVMYSTIENCELEKPEMQILPHYWSPIPGFGEVPHAVITYKDSICHPTVFAYVGGDTGSGPGYLAKMHHKELYSYSDDEPVDPCQPRRRFMFAEAPDWSFNRTGTPQYIPRITSVLCDSPLWSSTRRVTLHVNKQGFTIRRIDDPSFGQNREKIADLSIGDLGWFLSMGNPPFRPAPKTHFDAFFDVATMSHPTADMSKYFDPSQLQELVNTTWQSYAALFSNQVMRVSLPQSASIHVSNTAPVRRVVVNPIATRVLESALGAILFIIVTVSLLAPGKNVLRKPPYSIAAQMSMLVDSHLVHEPQLRNAQGLVGRTMWSGLRVKLGWWDCAVSGRRYGVDVVESENEELMAHVPLMPERDTESGLYSPGK